MNIAGKGPSAGKSRTGRALSFPSLKDKILLNAAANGNGFRYADLNKALIAANGPVLYYESEGSNGLEKHRRTVMFSNGVPSHLLSLEDFSSDHSLGFIEFQKSPKVVEAADFADYLQQYSHFQFATAQADYIGLVGTVALKPSSVHNHYKDTLRASETDWIVKVLDRRNAERPLAVAVVSHFLVNAPRKVQGSVDNMLVIKFAVFNSDLITKSMTFDGFPYVALEEETRAPIQWKISSASSSELNKVIDCLNLSVSSGLDTTDDVPASNYDEAVDESFTVEFTQDGKGEADSSDKEEIPKDDAEEVPKDDGKTKSSKKGKVSDAKEKKRLSSYINYLISFCSLDPAFLKSDIDFKSELTYDNTKQTVEQLIATAYRASKQNSNRDTFSMDSVTVRKDDKSEVINRTVFNWFSASNHSLWDSINPYLYLRSDNPGSNGLNSDIPHSLSTNLFSTCIWLYPTTQLTSVYQSLASVTAPRSAAASDLISDWYKQLALPSPSQQEKCSLDMYNGSAIKDLFLNKNFRGVVDGACYIGNILDAKGGDPGELPSNIRLSRHGIGATLAALATPQCIRRNADEVLAKYDTYMQSLGLADLVYVTSRETDRAFIHFIALPIVIADNSVSIGFVFGNALYVPDATGAVKQVCSMNAVCDAANTWVFGQRNKVQSDLTYAYDGSFDNLPPEVVTEENDYDS